MENTCENPALDTVRKLDAQRISATVSADIATLEGILSEDLVWTHASGNSDTRAQWLAKVGSGKVKYQSIVIDEAQFRSYEGAVVVNGKGSTSVVHHGGVDTFRMSITAVYAKFGSLYKLVSMQVTRIP